jgi:hypothetical protein
MEAVVGVVLEAEARGALGEGERGGGEVREVGVVEGGAGSALSEPVDGPDGRAVAPEAGDPPRAGELTFGGYRFRLSQAERGEELVAEGVLVEGRGGATIVVTASHWVGSFASSRARERL